MQQAFFQSSAFLDLLDPALVTPSRKFLELLDSAFTSGSRKEAILAHVESVIVGRGLPAFIIIGSCDVSHQRRVCHALQHARGCSSMPPLPRKVIEPVDIRRSC